MSNKSIHFLQEKQLWPKTHWLQLVAQYDIGIARVDCVHTKSKAGGQIAQGDFRGCIDTTLFGLTLGLSTSKISSFAVPGILVLTD